MLLKKRRAAAKDVGKLQLNNEALKLEIEQLKARAADDTRRIIAQNEEKSAAGMIEYRYVHVYIQMCIYVNPHICIYIYKHRYKWILYEYYLLCL